MITVTKKFSFCYGHYLPEYQGKCRNFHGHNSEVEVEVAGPTFGEYPGMVMDFGNIKKIVEPIIDELDHKMLNEHLSFQKYCSSLSMSECIPTGEAICGYLVEKIKEKIPTIIRVRVSETPTSWAEWRKD
jgi:6-pyruvoyltetrahydropterin/6-carboxytetrahydropterin synthase